MKTAATFAAESATNAFAATRDSYKHRLGPDGHRFQVKFAKSSAWKQGQCLAVPDAAESGWKDGKEKAANGGEK